MRYEFTPLLRAVSATAIAVFLTACGADNSAVPSTATEPTAAQPSASVVTTSGKSTVSTGVQERLDTELATRAEAARFLMQAGFGANPQTVESWTGRNAAAWVEEQMEKPQTLTLPIMQQRFNSTTETKNYHRDVLLESYITADDELRQRMALALLEIFVLSDNSFRDRGFTTAHYTDILVKNAFGNYRDLLEDVTYSPAMANYLTYMYNTKADPETGAMPDENYAREIMQLFSIGLVELNMDGTPKLDANGNTIETYTIEDISGLARVFTGFMPAQGSWTGWRNPAHLYERLTINEAHHSQKEKTFLGHTIGAYTDGERSVQQALDIIFEHPNVAPFISRQMIQRFTASHPAPDYVERVATAFEQGFYVAEDGTTFGTGTRGDLGATLAAVLLDASQHDTHQARTEGKVREPILKFIHGVRAFDNSPTQVDKWWTTRQMNGASTGLGQQVLRSPTVFNFFRPGYVAPNTESGNSEMTAPEFQIVNAGSAIGYVNYMTKILVDGALSPENNQILLPNYEDELALAHDAPALMDYLDVHLTGGRMSAQTKASAIDILETYTWPASDADAATIEQTALKRTSLAVLLTVTSGAYDVLD